MLHLKPYTAFLLFLLFFISAGEVYASGVREDPIRQARQLTQEQRYNEALELVAQAVQDDPERIWEAVRIIQQISAVRGEYNQEMKNLIQSLDEEPDNSARALEIIERMETIDRFPNPRTSQQVRDARRTVRFRFNQTEFIEIMEESAAFLAQSEYSNAVQRYLSGFDLFQEEFLEEGYGNIFENRVLGLAGELESVSEELLADTSQFLEIFPSLLNQIQTEDDIQQIISESDPLLQSLISARVQIVELADALDEENLIVPLLNEELEQDWYLVFLNRFALGRRDALTPEGIAGAAVLAMQEQLDVLINQAIERTENFRSQALNAFDQQDWDLSMSRWAALENYADGIEDFELYLVRIHEESGSLPDTARIVAEREGRLYNSIALQEISAGFLSMSENLINFSALSAQADKDHIQLADDALILQEAKELARILQAEWEPEIQTESTDQFSSEYLQRLVQWENEILDSQISLFNASAELRNDPLLTAFSAFEDVIIQSSTEIRGVSEEVDQDGDIINIVRRNPQDAIIRLNELENQFQEYGDLLDDFLAFLELIPEDAAASVMLIEQQETASELSSRWSQILSQTASLQEEALETIRLADEADAEGRNLLNQSRAALAQRNVDTARNLLNRADESFFDALDYRYDINARLEYETLITSLGEEILETQTILVIEQVRERINTARALFIQDEFFSAEQQLMDAQELWESVNPGDENPEIRTWTGLVRAALNLQTNREITEDSPLYFSLVPFLSRANELFTEGVNLIRQGRQPQAEEVFLRAENNLNAVISAQPFNQQARVLQLRIQQQIDPDTFEQTFETRFADAMARRSSDPQAALVDLQDLAAIQPNYPGINTAIFQLEITLGIRQAPIDRTAEIQSNNLLQRARQIGTGGSREQLQAAVGLLEEAIQVNPNNQDAIVLLDQYRIAIGGQVSATIGFEAQQRFREAEELFVQGDIATAYAIVQQLLQSSQNQRYTPLINLQRRIETRLGI